MKPGYPTEQLAKFESAFEKYLDAYMTGRDLASLEEIITEDFCGFGTGLDEIFSSKNSGLEIFQRDITSAPNPLHYTLRSHEIKPLDMHNAIVVSELDLETKILDQEIKLNNLRMMMVLHEEDDIVKIFGILVFSKVGSIVEANPAACSIYNYSREELVGLSGREIVHPNYHHLLVKFTNDVQQKGYFHAESVDVRSDGSHFHVEVNGTAILFNGEDCLLAVVRDITERKQAEKALNESEQRFRYTYL